MSDHKRKLDDLKDTDQKKEEISSSSSASKKVCPNCNSNINTANTTSNNGADLNRSFVSSSKIKNEDLQCKVCLELPLNMKLYQCEHGHLFCLDCLTRIVESNNAVCPVCRVSLSRSRPTRNRFAELVLNSIMIACYNDGCNKEMEFNKLNTHMNEKCKYRHTYCKYQTIGCDWYDLAYNLKKHEKECTFQSQDLNEILTNVKKRNIQNDEKVKEVENRMSKYVDVASLLEKRCRNIIFKDILIERDEICRVHSSQTFTAGTLAFQCILEPNVAGETGITLKLVEPCKRKVSLQVLVLRGPQLQNKLVPTIHKVVFKRKMDQSELLLLPVTKEEGKALFDQSVHLRIGFIDISRGRVKREFTSQADSEDESDSDSDNEDIYYDGHDDDMYDEDDSYTDGDYSGDHYGSEDSAESGDLMFAEDSEDNNY